MLTQSDVEEIIQVGLSTEDDRQTIILSLGYCDLGRWDQSIEVVYNGEVIAHVDLEEEVSEEEALRFAGDDEDIQDYLAEIAFSLEFEPGEPAELRETCTQRLWHCYWMSDGTDNNEDPERRVIFTLEEEGEYVP